MFNLLTTLLINIHENVSRQNRNTLPKDCQCSPIHVYFLKEMIKVIFVIIILLIQAPLCGNNQRPLMGEGFVISSMKYLFDGLSSIIICIYKKCK
jgi:hypothetical protein